jgi:hypothetical protein
MSSSERNSERGSERDFEKESEEEFAKAYSEKESEMVSEGVSEKESEIVSEKYPSPSELIHKTVEEQSLYADLVCRSNVNEPWLHEQISEMDPGMFCVWNTTSVGNVAYVALHASNASIRRRCVEILDEYRHWITSKYIKDIKGSSPPVQPSIELLFVLIVIGVLAWVTAR